MYQVTKTVRTTHGRDGAVVLDIREGQMFNLNVIGSRIVELLQAGSSEENIASQISAEFRVAKDIAEDDVREFLGALKKHRLVEPC
jgi:hypothetical protein